MTHFPGSKTFASALLATALLTAALLLPASSQTTARAKGSPRAAEWAVLAPVSYKNLTIFPVRGADLPGSDAYITLDEGTKAGTVTITERGSQSARGRIVHPNAPNSAAVQQQNVGYDSGASANELALVNRSGKKLVLLAGEVIVGGRQDRIVQEDRVIPPVSVPISLSVFCVEHGRGPPRATSYNGGGGSGGAAAAAPPAPEKFDSLGAVAHPKLRAAAQDKKVQSEVWNEVSANNARLGTSNSTDRSEERRVGKECRS